VTERLFVYVLGRGPARSDRAAVQAVLQSAGEEPTLRRLVVALTLSRAFTHGLAE